MKRPLLTPSTIPTAVTSRCLVYPDSQEWRAIINGLVAGAIYPQNWQPYGVVTPDQAAERCREMLYQFFNAEECNNLQYPKQFDIAAALMEYFLQTGTNSVNASATPWGNYVLEASGQIGNFYQTDFLLAAGSYSLEVYNFGASDLGIVDIYIDGQLKVNDCDLYLNTNALKKQAFNITISSDGNHFLYIVVVGKRAAATGYRTRLAGINIHQLHGQGGAG